MTSVIMIFEITRDYTIIVPLMISNLIAYYISNKLQPDPIYEALAHQDGIHLPTTDARLQPARAQVDSVMRDASEAFSPDTPAAVAVARMTAESVDAWPVVDGEDLLGMVRLQDLEQAGMGVRIAEVLTEGQASSHDHPPHVHPDHSLHLALERLGASGLPVIPVVSRANERQLVGIGVLHDILAAYGLDTHGVDTHGVDTHGLNTHGLNK
jgi:CIC family chloride channel protein